MTALAAEPRPAIADLLRAARADAIPEGASGLWSVFRRTFERPVRMTSADGGNVQRVLPGTYTFLARATAAAAMTDFGAECVMHDAEPELRTHLQAMLRARGRVLVTGLGLGCVVRGMLCNPAVREVVVLERESAVLHLVAGHMPRDVRLRIVHAEARDWLRANASERFDFAWHDIWTDAESGEPHLAVVHTEIMRACLGRVREQDAWAFPHRLKRIMREATRRCS